LCPPRLRFASTLQQPVIARAEEIRICFDGGSQVQCIKRLHPARCEPTRTGFDAMICRDECTRLG